MVDHNVPTSDRRFGIDVTVEQVAACVGTKEMVATTPQYLKLRTPSRDTVLYPAVAYPTYEMGAILAGCRPVAVPMASPWLIQERDSRVEPPQQLQGRQDGLIQHWRRPCAHP